MKKYLISIMAAILVVFSTATFAHAGWTSYMDESYYGSYDNSYDDDYYGSSNSYTSNCRITSFRADEYEVYRYDETTVYWSTSGCDTVAITPAEYPDNRPPSGSVSTGMIYHDTTYTLIALDYYGNQQDSRNLTIRVVDEEEETDCRINSFTANNTTVDRGDSTTVRWTTSGCDTVSITPADYPEDRPANGSVSTGSIYSTTTYQLTAYDQYGDAQDNESLTIRVTNDDNNGDDECRINSFDADDTSIDEGDSTYLRWNTTGCDYVDISGVDDDMDEDGSERVSPRSDRTYTIRAYPGGDSDSVTIRVDEDNDNNDDDDECSIDSFYAESYSLVRGSSTTIHWRTSGVDDVDITPNYSNRSDDGSQRVSPSSNTTYTIRVRGNGCSESESLTIRVGDTSAPNTQPQAITTAANSVSATGALLNGIAVPNISSGTTSAYFEWGPGTNMIYKTAAKSVGSGSNTIAYNDAISGMSPGTAYFYRAVVENKNGTARGEMVRIPTVSATTTVAGATVSANTRTTTSIVARSAPSLLELRVQSAYDRMCIGGEMDYTVNYRNVSTTNLLESVVRIALPTELTYVSAAGGSYNEDDRTVTVDLGTLDPNESGSITIRARVNDQAVRGNLSVITATVVYTNADTRAQEDAIAYSLITVSDDCPNLLGASVFGFGSFLPDTLLEWLLLILIILALVLLGRQLYKKKEEKKPVA